MNKSPEYNKGYQDSQLNNLDEKITTILNTQKEMKTTLDQLVYWKAKVTGLATAISIFISIVMKKFL